MSIALIVWFPLFSFLFFTPFLLQSAPGEAGLGGNPKCVWETLGSNFRFRGKRECQVNKHFLKPTFGNFLPPYIHLYFRIVYNDVVGILYHFTDNDPRAVIGQLITLLSRLVLLILIFVFERCFITNTKVRNRKNTTGQLASHVFMNYLYIYFYMVIRDSLGNGK